MREKNVTGQQETALGMTFVRAMANQAAGISAGCT